MALLQGLMSNDGKRPENHQNEETFRTPQAKRLRRMKLDRDSLTQSNRLRCRRMFHSTAESRFVLPLMFRLSIV